MAQRFTVGYIFNGNPTDLCSVAATEPLEIELEDWRRNKEVKQEVKVPAVVIRRVIQRLGIHRVTICNIYIVLIAKQDKSNVIAWTYEV